MAEASLPPESVIADDPPAGRARSRSLVLPILALVLVAGLTYLRPLVLGETFAVRDNVALTIPSRAYLAARLHQGQIPEWWDAVRLGERFAAEPNNGVTYPPTWLVALGDPLWFTDLVTILHVLLAGVGGLLLARRLGASPWGAFFSGAALMLSGYVTSTTVNGPIIVPVCWLPVVAWAALGIGLADDAKALFRRSLAFAAVMGGAMVTGNPGTFNAVVLAVAIVAVTARRRLRALGALAGAGLLGALMGAVSLLPAVMTLRDSSRGGGIPWEMGAAWSMHPLRMLEWIWPAALGQGLRPERNLGELLAHTGGIKLQAFWAASLYVGVPVLLCAAIAVARGGTIARRLGLLSLVFVVLALGSFTPAYAAYRFLVWPERLLRYPEKHFESALVLWVALAGPGLDWLFRRISRRTVLLCALPALVIALATTTLWLARGTVIEHLASLSRVTGRSILADEALAISIAGGLIATGIAAVVPLALLLARSTGLRPLAAPLLVVVTIGQLVAHDYSVHVTIPREDLRARPEVFSSLPEPAPGQWPRFFRRVTLPGVVSGEMRAFVDHHTGLQNDAGRFGFGQMEGYVIATTPRFKNFAEASQSAPLERVMDLVDGQYLILPATEAGATGLPTLTREPVFGQVLQENKDRRPRAFVAYRWRSDVSDEEALHVLFAGPGSELDLGQILLARPGTNELAAPGGPTPCKLERPRPEHVQLRCRAERDGWAVLADAWNLGWTATVDGRPAPIERADVLLRAVAITAGEHIVELRYRTPGLVAGFAVTIISCAILVGLLLVAGKGARARRLAGAKEQPGVG